MTNRISPPDFAGSRAVIFRWLLVSILIGNAVFIGLTCFSLSQSRLLYEENAETTTKNLAHVFAGDMNDFIDKIDINLLVVANETERQFAAGKFNPQNFEKFIGHFKSFTSIADNLYVINAQGKIVYNTGANSGTVTNINNPSWEARLHNDPLAGLIISKPMSAKGNKWSITFARRFNQPDGSFAGTVCGMVTLERLLKTFSSLNVGNHGALALRDDELRLIARYPEPGNFNSLVGNKNASPELQQATQLNQEAGIFTSVAFDKIQRTYAYCKVPHYPLYAIAGLSTEDYLAAWWIEVRFDLVLTLFFLLGSVVLAGLVYRSWKQIISNGETLAQQKEALTNERALLRTLVDHLPVSVYLKDNAVRKTFANSVDLRNLGVASEAEALGKLDSDFFPPEQAAGFMADDERVIRTGLPLLNREEKVTRPDGSTRWILTSKVPLTDSAGNVTGLAGIGLDITERKLLDAALRESEERLRFALDEIGAGAWDLDLVDHTAYRSLKHDQIFGYETLLPRWTYEMFLEHVVPQDRATVDQKFREAMENKGDWHFECRIIRRDGAQRWILARGRHRFDLAGQPRRITGIVQDITERKALEEQRRHSQKLEAVGQLASGVAHDFNNILAVIQLQANLLKTAADLSAEGRDCAKDIELATERAAKLTRQLLQFSRKEALHQCDLDLSEVVASVFKMLERLLGGLIQVKFNFSAQPLLVHADAGMLEQVLMNLTVNARDAMPKGGQLIIETTAVEFDAVTAAQGTQARPGAFACLSVTDTGCGIKPEVLPRIYEPFFTTKEVGKGSGLGLSAVFGIVQEHRGWINVYSEVGKGTTFRIYLPRLGHASDKKPPASPPAASRVGSETILLVEDDADVRMSLRTSLTRLGYQVLEAGNGEEALEVWKKHRAEIRLLLTDLMMPGGMNGIELAKHLLQQNPKLKVVYASGYSAGITSTNKEPLLQEGINFLAKPFDSPKLAQILRNCLDQGW